MIEKMINQNSILKENFDSYDMNKDKFYQDIIDGMEMNHKENLNK
jgi:hypothetical protein